MTDTVSVAVITTVGSVVVALFGFMAHQLKGIKKDASEARYQVKNSHKSNMRDDMDAIHQEIRDFREERREDHKEVLAIRKDIRRLTSTDRAQWDAIGKLQDKQNRGAHE